MLKDRINLGLRAGVDYELAVGLERTLVSRGMAEHVEQRKMDTSKDEQPKRAPRKRKRSKATPKNG